MSIKATLWAWRLLNLSPAEKLVLLWLADGEDPDSLAEVDSGSLFDRTGVNCTDLLLKGLEKKGLITIVSLGPDSGHQARRFVNGTIVKLHVGRFRFEGERPSFWKEDDVA